MTETDLDKHVKILGWLHIVMSCLFLIIGIIVAAVMIFGGVPIGTALGAYPAYILLQSAAPTYFE